MLKEEISKKHRNQVADQKEPDAKSAYGYIGRGAYTGMHILGDDIKYIGSTFRHQVPRTRDRWFPKDKKKWGYIGTSSASLPGMKDIQPETKTELFGYVHGMIQAIYSEAYDGFKGETIEVAVGEKTTKLASCFACTTFMCASDRPPDAVHLGHQESWSPVFGKGSIKELEDRRQKATDPYGKRTAVNMEKTVNYVNKKWQKKCASWLYWGTTIDMKCLERTRYRSWQKLRKFAEDNRGEIGPSANLFLDALTHSKKAQERVNDTLRSSL